MIVQNYRAGEKNRPRHNAYRLRRNAVNLQTRKLCPFRRDRRNTGRVDPFISSTISGNMAHYTRNTHSKSITAPKEYLAQQKTVSFFNERNIRYFTCVFVIIRFFRLTMRGIFPRKRSLFIQLLIFPPKKPILY